MKPMDSNTPRFYTSKLPFRLSHINRLTTFVVLIGTQPKTAREAPSCARTKPRLDELLESAVEGRAQRLDVLVELDGADSALGDPLGCELEFLMQF